MTREEFLKQFVFISYTPTDPALNYRMCGYVKLLYNGLTLVFKEQNKKDGSGTFVASQSLAVTDCMNQKSYVETIDVDAKTQLAWLMDFIRECIDLWKSKNGVSREVSNCQPPF